MFKTSGNVGRRHSIQGKCQENMSGKKSAENVRGGNVRMTIDHTSKRSLIRSLFLHKFIYCFIYLLNLKLPQQLLLP